jgi:hypothetical protein
MPTLNWLSAGGGSHVPVKATSTTWSRRWAGNWWSSTNSPLSYGTQLKKGNSNSKQGGRGGGGGRGLFGAVDNPPKD